MRTVTESPSLVLSYSILSKLINRYGDALSTTYTDMVSLQHGQLC